MISFRDRYNAYLAAQKIANRTATVLSLIITAGILVMLVLWFDLGADFLKVYIFDPFQWHNLLTLVYYILILFFFGIVDSILERIFLKIFFKRKLRQKRNQ